MEYSIVRADAIRLLGRKDLTEAEVRRELLGRGHDAEAVEMVVSDLVGRTIINDSRTLENLIASHTGRRAIGVDKLKAKLERRGIREEQLEIVLEAARADESERARELLESRFPDPEASGGWPKLAAKAARFLASRGFSEESVESAIQSYFPNRDA